MARWLRNPQSVDALTAMPNLGITEGDVAISLRFLQRCFESGM